MELVSERSFDTMMASIYDPLDTYRRAAKSALKDPETDFDDPRAIYPGDPDFPLDSSMSDEDADAWSRLDRETLVAFTRVVRFLKSLEPGGPFFNHQRSSTVSFLTGSNVTGSSPTIDTGNGQLIRIDRGSDAEVEAVTVVRSDGGHVTAQDLRFPFRAVKDFDAQERIGHRHVHELNRRFGGVKGAADADRELATLDALAGDSRLKLVADLYEEALGVGKSTGQHIADEMFVSQNYARQLISRARKRGFIPPVTAPEGKAD